MPEILTAHPDIVKSMLTKTGAKCSGNKKAEILRDCPQDSLCIIPNVGEFCVLGTNEADKLTQFNIDEILNKKKEGFHLFESNPTIKVGWSGDLATLLGMIAFLPFLCLILINRTVKDSYIWIMIKLISYFLWLVYGFVNELLPVLIFGLYYFIAFIIVLILKIALGNPKKK